MVIAEAYTLHCIDTLRICCILGLEEHNKYNKKSDDAVTKLSGSESHCVDVLVDGLNSFKFKECNGFVYHLMDAFELTNLD